VRRKFAIGFMIYLLFEEFDHLSKVLLWKLCRGAKIFKLPFQISDGCIKIQAQVRRVQAAKRVTHLRRLNAAMTKILAMGRMWMSRLR
jgi:hypothetical protein